MLYGRVQARAGKLLGVMGTDVPLKEITKLTPQYKVFRYAISQSMAPEFWLPLGWSQISSVKMQRRRRYVHLIIFSCFFFEKYSANKIVINRFFVKLFQTNNTEIARACQEFFGFELPSALLPKRV